MPNDFSVSGVILAGGESRRMGVDKAGLVFEGKTFLERIIESMKGIFEETLVVGRRKGDEEAYFVPDLREGAGPLGGIYTGLFFSPSFWTLFVPCDMPFLEPSLYEKLLQARDPGGRRLAAFLSEDRQRIEHFPLLVPKPYLRVVRHRLEIGENSVRSFLNRAQIEGVELGEFERGKIKSFNTPEEYEHLLTQSKEVCLG